jgi:membrane protease YdiL (CAAX protease family)
VTNPNSNDPQMEPLGRMQVLSAMGITALVLLLIARFWLLFDAVFLLPVTFQLEMVGLGVALGVAITLASAGIYRLWPQYRQSADLYLKLVLHPLTWIDLIWMGLLPGLSEEFLFRGVMLPAIGLNMTGVIFSSLCFGVLHLSGLQQWPYVVWATLVGLVLGLSALTTGNLLVPIVAHIFTNLCSSLMWKWRFQEE